METVSARYKMVQRNHPAKVGAFSGQAATFGWGERFFTLSMTYLMQNAADRWAGRQSYRSGGRWDSTSRSE